MSVERKYHLFDAQKNVLGRMATEIATALSGKGRIDYAPHLDQGDFVVVINSDNLKVTGNKLEDKMYHHHSGHPGGLRSIALKDQIEKDSREAIKSAVYGMLPKNKLRARMLKRLFIYKDDKHTHNIDIKH